MKPKLLTTQEWEKSAKNFNFKDDRAPFSETNWKGMSLDIYQLAEAFSSRRFAVTYLYMADGVG